MNKVIVSLIILFSSNVIAVNDYGMKYVEIKNEPESELCKDMKEVVKDGQWVDVNVYTDPERMPHRPLGTDKIKFYNYKTAPFSSVRDGKTTEFPSDYFLLDINNDGEDDFFDIVTGDRGASGDTSSMDIYKYNWLLLGQPMNYKIIREVKAIIGNELGIQMQALKGENNYLPFYSIYVFKWHDINYLLLQRFGWSGANEGLEKDKSFYAVAELDSGYKMHIHCFYVNNLKK